MGWTDDQFRLLFQPLAHDAKEAIWSMGDDAPPAYLSTSRRALWDYCKQRFAQVTNPPIDPLREAHVMSLDVYLGRDLVIDSPVLDAGQTAVLENLLLRPVHIVDLTFYAADGVQGAQAAIERIRDDIAEAMITEPAMILLTDRDATEKRAAVPVLLAVAAAWKEIVRSGGHRIPIVVETGQVIETHHLALLIAVGASAVYPYLAMELAENVRDWRRGEIPSRGRGWVSQSFGADGNFDRGKLPQQPPFRNDRAGPGNLRRIFRGRVGQARREDARPALGR